MVCFGVGLNDWNEDLTNEMIRIGKLLIAVFESSVQNVVVIYEIFYYGFSVNFLQAAHPILSVIMIYVNLGPVFGEIFLGLK